MAPHDLALAAAHRRFAELAFLSKLISSRAAVLDPFCRLREEDFAEARHALLYRAVCEAAKPHAPLTPAAVLKKLEDLGLAERTGGKRYLDLLESLFCPHRPRDLLRRFARPRLTDPEPNHRPPNKEAEGPQPLGISLDSGPSSLDSQPPDSNLSPLTSHPTPSPHHRRLAQLLRLRRARIQRQR